VDGSHDSGRHGVDRQLEPPVDLLEEPQETVLLLIVPVVPAGFAADVQIVVNDSVTRIILRHHGIL
jgi:hypothetical protein